MTYTCGCPEYEQRISALEAEIAALKAERDAARAWAAMWKRAATYERATTMWPLSTKRSVQVYRSYGSVARRARRAAEAAEAAEAMERR